MSKISSDGALEWYKFSPWKCLTPSPRCLYYYHVVCIIALANFTVQKQKLILQCRIQSEDLSCLSSLFWLPIDLSLVCSLSLFSIFWNCYNSFFLSISDVRSFRNRCHWELSFQRRIQGTCAPVCSNSFIFMQFWQTFAKTPLEVGVRGNSWIHHYVHVLAFA